MTSDGTIHLSVAGEIDLATIEEFEEALARAVAVDGTPRILVDFGDVGFCDSSGVAALDRAYHEAAVRGVALRVIRLQEGVHRLLEVTGLLDSLTAR
ncbi:STAS domain-containing protein [Actinoplanes sp. URMC 104]